MAMTKCKERGQEVSSSAKVCPHCGKKLKKGCGYYVALVIIILILFWVYRRQAGQAKADKEVGTEIVEGGFILRVLGGSGGFYDIQIPSEYLNLEDMTEIGEVLRDKYKGQPQVGVTVYVGSKWKENEVGKYTKMTPFHNWTIKLDGADKPPTKIIDY